MKIYYTNIEKKKLCNRNNGTLKTLPRIDFQVQSTFSVVFIDSLNKIIEIDPTDSFYIAGGIDVMKDSSNLLFYSDDFTLDNNMLRFTVNTYTDNYLKHIKNTGTPIYLEIGIINEKKTILLQDIVLAQPRVYLDGVAPINIEVYYTKEEIDKKFADVKIEQTDPIYTADKANIALKSEIPTKLSQLENDEGYIKEQTDPVYTADKEYIALKSELPSKLSQLQNDEGYIKSINGLPPDENGNVSLESGNKVIEYVNFGQSVIQTDNLNTLADIYWCQGSIYGVSTGDFSFPTFSFNEEITSERQVKTIQLWVNCQPDIEVIYVPSDWTIIDEDNFPTNLTTGTTSVFVVRIYIDFNGNIHTIINYAYSFDEQ